MQERTFRLLLPAKCNCPISAQFKGYNPLSAATEITVEKDISFSCQISLKVYIDIDVLTHKFTFKC